MAVNGVKPVEQETLLEQIKDWLLEHGDMGLAALISIGAFVAVLVRPNVDRYAVIIAALIVAASVTQLMLRHKAKQRIDDLKHDLGASLEREEQYAEEARKLHAGTKAALTAWLTAASTYCGLSHKHRMSLFIVSSNEGSAYLLARYSQNPEFNRVEQKTYTNDGAVKRAWQEGKFVSSILPDLRSGAKKRDYVNASVKIFPDVRKGRVEKSEMSPRYYASWRLDVNEEPLPSVLVFESQLDDLEKSEIVEAQVRNDATRAMRHLAALVRDFEVAKREATKVDIEGESK